MPSSDLHIAESLYRQTTLDDLLGIPEDKVNDDRLYRTLDRVFVHKDAIEQHLRDRIGKLFGIKYDLLLYDVTSTYFEGQVLRNPQAKRGHSRDHRPDCKQVCIALVRASKKFLVEVQMQKVLCLGCCSGVHSPTMAPSRTDQKVMSGRARVLGNGVGQGGGFGSLPWPPANGRYG